MTTSNENKTKLTSEQLVMILNEQGIEAKVLKSNRAKAFGCISVQITDENKVIISSITPTWVMLTSFIPYVIASIYYINTYSNSLPAVQSGLYLALGVALQTILYYVFTKERDTAYIDKIKAIMKSNNIEIIK